MTVLKILGIIFLAVIVLFAGLLVWGYLAGKGMQEDFYNAVLSGDSGQVMDLLHPSIREKVDEPVVAAWMAHFKDRMGALEGLSKSNFSIETKNGQTTSEGKVEFEKGDATSELTLKDDKVISFHVKSELLAGSWIQRLESTEFLRDRAKQFLTALARGEADAALDLMHPALRAKLSEDEFKQSLQNLLSRAGELSAVTFEREKFTEESGQSLETYFRVTCANGEVAAKVRFEFVEFHGAILGFQLPYKQ